MKNFSGGGGVWCKLEIMSAGEKPCKACSDFRTWIKTGGPKDGSKGPERPSGGGTEASSSSRQAVVPQLPGPAATATATASAPLDCPLDKDDLGRKTWALLHSISVYLPEGGLEASKRREVEDFMGLVSKLYPCEPCAIDMRQDIKQDPPDTSSGSAFAGWLCRLHNKTNRKLGKPEFDCTKVYERWRDGPPDGSCD